MRDGTSLRSSSSCVDIIDSEFSFLPFEDISGVERASFKGIKGSKSTDKDENINTAVLRSSPSATFNSTLSPFTGTSDNSDSTTDDSCPASPSSSSSSNFMEFGSSGSDGSSLHNTTSRSAIAARKMNEKKGDRSLQTPRFPSFSPSDCEEPSESLWEYFKRRLNQSFDEADARASRWGERMLGDGRYGGEETGFTMEFRGVLTLSDNPTNSHFTSRPMTIEPAEDLKLVDAIIRPNGRRSASSEFSPPTYRRHKRQSSSISSTTTSVINWIHNLPPLVPLPPSKTSPFPVARLPPPHHCSDPAACNCVREAPFIVLGTLLCFWIMFRLLKGLEWL